MNDNELLIEKVKTQKILDDRAEHDLAKYVSDTHARIEALAARLELKLTYGTPTNKAVAEVCVPVFRCRLDQPSSNP